MHLKQALLATLALATTLAVSTRAQTTYPPVQSDAVSQSQALPTVGSPPAAATPDMSQVQELGVPLAQVSSVPAQPLAEGTTPTPPAQPATLGLPFQLSDVEQQFVDQILQMWENKSKEVKTYDCAFDRLEYDPVFGPKDKAMIHSKGQLSYSKPDKGSFKIDQIERYEAKDGTYKVQKHEVGEHWVCDGKAIYEYKHDKKQLVVSALPEEMRGQSIVDGPLPFLFGAEAAKLKARYWIRSRQSDEKTIWLEAFPRTQADAANYHHVDVMLDRKTMMPSAIQVHMPNGRNSAVYTFQNPHVNGTLDALFGSLFSSPRTPLGWTRVVEEIPTAPQASQPSTTQLK
jgi:TIGR03009 family protein